MKVIKLWLILNIIGGVIAMMTALLRADLISLGVLGISLMMGAITLKITMDVERLNP